MYGILKEDIWVTTIIKAHFIASMYSPETMPDVGTAQTDKQVFLPAMCNEKISS